MHWTSAQPGCLDAERELVLINQSPGEIVFLSAADTDLTSVSVAWRHRFGSRLRLAHAFALRQPVAADHYINTVVRKSKLLVARLLGGKSYFAHFIQGLLDLKEEGGGPKCLILPGTGSDDLDGLSDFPPAVCRRISEFFENSGKENLERAAGCIELLMEGCLDDLPEPVPTPESGIYKASTKPGVATVWICFYRAWLQAGDLDVIDALFSALEDHGAKVICFYSVSLRNPLAQADLLARVQIDPPDIVVTTQSFSLGANDTERVSIFENLNVPVLQLPVALCSRQAWLKNLAGLSPAEIAMNIALPELDGRLFGTVIGFKEEERWISEIEFAVKRLKPDLSQVAYASEWGKNWIALRRLSNADKRVAVVLSNYPNRDGRIGNGVGLDTPASTVKLLEALREEGYRVEPCPRDSEELMLWLQSGITNDPEQSYGKESFQSLGLGSFKEFFDSLPQERRDQIERDWPEAVVHNIPVAGIQLGNVFVGIQPPRGFSQQTQAIYHNPTLSPPPAYLAFYLWIRKKFAAHAIIHLGKHGNLEWLPGRSVALGDDDFPRLCLGPLPHFYPFIVNNPGEGSQAKRRSAAVIVDHLTPPLTRAGLYGELEKMERLLEEHAHCANLYPARREELEGQISRLLESSRWRDELPGASIEAIGNFLCEIKESQIRSALHILGEQPKGDRQIDFLLSVLRVRSGGRPDLLAALYKTMTCPADAGRDRDKSRVAGSDLRADREKAVASEMRPYQTGPQQTGPCQAAYHGGRHQMSPSAWAEDSIHAETPQPRNQQTFSLDSLSPNERDSLNATARAWIADVLHNGAAVDEAPGLRELRALIRRVLVPRLSQCKNELKRIIKGLNGEFVPPGPAGAPTRGRIDVLPTGRNFFAIDPRAIPTQTAWECGKRIGSQLLERHLQDNGEYPRKLALVIWGTSNMRTGGDDIAQALWLWGCEPVWEEASGRVVDFRILPLNLLGRPRVDLLLRVSGLFRDSFGETMRLLATVPKRLAEQDEPLNLNPIRASWLAEVQNAVGRGLRCKEASRIATLRVFSSEPGAYGTGLLPLIDAGNWETARDITDVFCKWGGFAFDSEGVAEEQLDLFRTRLSEIEVVHQNQDNREHDILDSDDYFQFQGGLHAAVTNLRGKAPATYHGDSSSPERPGVRTLEEELIKVIRSRVLNPRWIDAMRDHGYKGAFEMAATVDYLFGYGATTNLIRDTHYQEIAQTLLLDPQQQEFFKKYNPAAFQDATERILEAAERGLWKRPDLQTISALEQCLLELQGRLE
jgi:cobaltochelatase CobN